MRYLESQKQVILDEMLRQSKKYGKYVVYLDTNSGITKMWKRHNAEIVYNTICCVDNGSIKKLCKYGIEFTYGDINGGLEWRGKPAHTMVWKSSIAKKFAVFNLSV